MSDDPFVVVDDSDSEIGREVRRNELAAGFSSGVFAGVITMSVVTIAVGVALLTVADVQPVGAVIIGGASAFLLLSVVADSLAYHYAEMVLP